MRKRGCTTVDTVKHIFSRTPNPTASAQSDLFRLPVKALVQFAELARDVGFPLDLKGLPIPVHLRNKTDQPLRTLPRHAQFDVLLAKHEGACFDRARKVDVK